MKAQYFGTSSQKTDAAAVNPDQAMLFNPLTRIGQETRECYRHQALKISVELHIRYTYVCEQRHEDVITAPNLPTLLPKTMASPSLLAHLVTSKFDDGIPLYRVSRQLERSGMDLSPVTAGTWVNRIGGDKIIPLIELLRETIFVPDLIHMDESYVRVHKSEKSPTSTHYMVAHAAGPPGKRIILYDYIPSRTREALKQVLVCPVSDRLPAARAARSRRAAA